MKLVVFISLALLALVAAQRPITTRWTSCTLSGDPHFVTFDGAYHDFQGEGIFQAAKNDFVNVQYQALRCNLGAPTPVTCVRRVTVQILNPSNEAEVGHVDWTSWPGQVSLVFVDNQNYTTGALTGVGKAVATVGGLASVSFAGGQLSIVSSRGTFEVVIGQYYLAVKLPFISGSFGNTFGVCGYFDGDGNNEFTGTNGTLFIASRTGTRTNGPQVNAWGAAFAATAAGSIKPLASKHMAWNLQSGNLELLDTVPTPVIPTDEQTEAMKRVAFADTETFRIARARCEQLSAGDEVTIENCMYDNAVLSTDTLLAASNAAAAQAAVITSEEATTSSSSNNGPAVVAGAVVGSIAFVALVTAIVLYVRLRKVSAAYSRALIVRQQSNTNQASTKPEDNLSDHL